MTSPDIHRPLAHRVWELLDQRPPQAIQAMLERATDSVFAPVAGAPATRRAATFVLGRVRFRLAMDFVAVLRRGLHYRVEATADIEAGADGLMPPDAERRSAELWIDLWTVGLHSQPRPPVAGKSFVQRHAEMLAAWRDEEAGLADVAATQQAILRALRHGQTFSIAHEEGGTTIRAAVRGFVSEDHGESIHVRRFADDADFLDHLRQLYHWEISRLTWLAPVPEAHAWRLIYRQLDPAGRTLTPGSGSAAAVVAVCLLAGSLTWMKLDPNAQALRAEPARFAPALAQALRVYRPAGSP